MLNALDLTEKELGPEHPDTLTSMGNLARIYSEQGEYERAGELELKALDLSKKVLGSEHPDTLHSIENLARTYT